MWRVHALLLFIFGLNVFAPQFGATYPYKVSHNLEAWYDEHGNYHIGSIRSEDQKNSTKIVSNEEAVAEAAITLKEYYAHLEKQINSTVASQHYVELQQKIENGNMKDEKTEEENLRKSALICVPLNMLRTIEDNHILRNIDDDNNNSK